jgi:hypothetical protein
MSRLQHVKTHFPIALPHLHIKMRDERANANTWRLHGIQSGESDHKMNYDAIKITILGAPNIPVPFREILFVQREYSDVSQRALLDLCILPHQT